MTSDANALLRKVADKKPNLASTAWAAPGVVLVGDVRLHAGSSVWYNSVLRADDEYIEIGEDANVQDGCIAHTDDGFPTIVGKRVSVGHRAVLHGCRIGDDSLIGMGAILLNGVVVGAKAMIAAGTVVLEGSEIPPGSLYAGIPGKVRRMLSDREKEGLVHNAAIYQGLRDLHATALNYRP